MGPLGGELAAADGFEVVGEAGGVLQAGFEFAGALGDLVEGAELFAAEVGIQDGAGCPGGVGVIDFVILAVDAGAVGGVDLVAVGEVLQNGEDVAGVDFKGVEDFLIGDVGEGVRFGEFSGEAVAALGVCFLEGLQFGGEFGGLLLCGLGALADFGGFFVGFGDFLAGFFVEGFEFVVG